MIVLSSCLNRELPSSNTAIISYETIPEKQKSIESDTQYSSTTILSLDNESMEPDKSIPEISLSMEVPGKTFREEIRKETIMIEGLKEEVIYKLFTSQKGYSLYYDTNYFQVIENEKTDKICSTYADDDTDINSLTIEHIENTSPADEMDLRINSEKEISWEIYIPVEDIPDFEFEDGTICHLNFIAREPDVGQHPGLRISKNVYFISDNAGGTYVFSISCTTEAWEGAGSRLSEILSTFVFE